MTYTTSIRYIAGARLHSREGKEMSAVEVMWYREVVLSRENIDEKDLPESEKEKRLEEVRKEKPQRKH